MKVYSGHDSGVSVSSDLGSGLNFGVQGLGFWVQGMHLRAGCSEFGAWVVFDS